MQIKIIIHVCSESSVCFDCNYKKEHFLYFPAMIAYPTFSGQTDLQLGAVA